MSILSIEEYAKLTPAAFPMIGLDVGSKTIGLSLSDRSGMIASPLMTIERTKFSKDIIALEKLIHEHKIQGCAIGLPLNMEGTRSPRTQSTLQFAQNFIAKINLPVIMIDERLSTSAVTQVMLEANLSRKRRSELVDKLAASYILQMALDRIHKLTK